MYIYIYKTFRLVTKVWVLSCISHASISKICILYHMLNVYVYILKKERGK